MNRARRQGASLEDDGEGRDVRLSGQQCRVRQAGEPPSSGQVFKESSFTTLEIKQGDFD